MELLSVQEAAKRAGVTSKAIYYSVNHGKLTAHKKYGRVLVDASEVDKYKPKTRATINSLRLTATSTTKQSRLIQLVESWTHEDPEYDIKAHALLQKTLDENPMTFREYVFE